jgi:hypothetical protein
LAALTKYSNDNGNVDYRRFPLEKEIKVFDHTLEICEDAAEGLV